MTSKIKTRIAAGISLQQLSGQFFIDSKDLTMLYALNKSSSLYDINEFYEILNINKIRDSKELKLLVSEFIKNNNKILVNEKDIMDNIIAIQN